jgi:hypothetical protein
MSLVIIHGRIVRETVVVQRSWAPIGRAWRTRLAAKRTDVARIGRVEVSHGFRLPAARGFYGGWLAPRSGLMYIFEDAP